MHALLHSVSPTLQQATANPRLCWRLGHSQASLGQSLVWSLLLSPGSCCTQGFVCTLQESVSPDLCKFWCSMVGLMATSSKRAYAISRSPAPRAPAAVHFWPVPLQETLKHSSVSVSLGSLGPGAHKVCLSPLWASLAAMGFDSKCYFALPTILLGLIFCPWMWSISSVTVV